MGRSSRLRGCGSPSSRPSSAALSGRDALVSSLMTLPAFRAQLELDVERAQRYGRPLTIAIVDIDRFRYLNMKRGYAMGDKILHAVGELLVGADPRAGPHLPVRR